ncbi:MAG: hypothetical protein M3O70_23160 [Actinomycetota bacterium]|nr:hypothetical protein [Actinomycetota bacterium]
MSLEDYEQLGDPEAEHELTGRDHREQRTSEDIQERARKAAAMAPPLSTETLEKVAALMSVRTPPSHLMRWRLRLYCGHVTTQTAHASHKSVHAAFGMGRRCEECGRDPSAIVAARAIGLVGESASSDLRATMAEPAERKRIERRIGKLESELAQLRRRLDGGRARCSCF